MVCFQEDLNFRPKNHLQIKKNGSVIFDQKNSNETFCGDFKKATLHKLLKNWNNTIMRICARKLGHDKKNCESGGSKNVTFYAPFFRWLSTQCKHFYGTPFDLKAKKSFDFVAIWYSKNFFHNRTFLAISETTSEANRKLDLLLFMGLRKLFSHFLFLFLW